MFQVPQYKNQYGDAWGSLAQFGGTSGYLNSPETSLIGGGVTSQGGPDLINYGGTANTGASNLGAFTPTWMQNMTGYTDPASKMKVDGWGGGALDIGKAAFGAYNAMKMYGLGKDQLAFQKDSFNKNYTAQKTTTNTALEDRQRARVASNAGAYESVGNYMNQNRVR